MFETPAQYQFATFFMYAIALPYFFILMGLEGLALKRRAGNTAGLQAPIDRLMGYELTDSLCSIAMGAFKLVTMGVAGFLTMPLFYHLYANRIWSPDISAWWFVPVLIVAEDLCYYWYHRAGHRIALFWAEHSNHHTSEHYNLSTALRQSLLGPFYAFVFWLPLPLLGIDPLALVFAKTFNLLYQYWLHTEVFEVKGRLEKVLNCPQHHRLHHARNVEYHDCNYGGIFIVWDRWFGTYRDYVPGLAPVYGTVKPEPSRNPLYQGIAGWKNLIEKCRQMPGLRAKVQCMWMPPDWTPQAVVTGRPG
jgi:sterol desaturase/sphingolipid hydroxylase (fatty acid hydroxylase superfamily)